MRSVVLPRITLRGRGAPATDSPAASALQRRSRASCAMGVGVTIFVYDVKRKMRDILISRESCSMRTPSKVPWPSLSRRGNSEASGTHAPRCGRSIILHYSTQSDLVRQGTLHGKINEKSIKSIKPALILGQV